LVERVKVEYCERTGKTALGQLAIHVEGDKQGGAKGSKVFMNLKNNQGEPDN